MLHPTWRKYVGKPGSNAARAVTFVLATLVVTCFVIGGTLTGAYLAVQQIVTTTAVDYAKALGLALDPSEVRFGFGFVQLLDSRFVALKVPGVSGSIKRLDVDLEFPTLRPSRMFVSGVAVEAKGDPMAMKDASLRYWEQLRPTLPRSKSASSMPEVEWRHLSLNVVTGNPLLSNLTATELTIATDVGPTHDETTIRTASTKVGSFNLGALEIAMRNQDGLFELGWGPTLHESKWRVAYRSLPYLAQVKFSFQPIAAGKLVETLGAAAVPEAFRATKLSGHIEGVYDVMSGKTAGAATVNLAGFSPPYPPELKGYRFATETTMRTQFEVDPLWFAVELRGIELRTGELSLVGHGRIDRELLSARLRADLSTTLDCITLAKGYATDAVGGELGQWAAKNAPKAVRGSVAVRVQVDADSNRLSQAKLVKRVGIGCGLRPMSLVDLIDLGLPPIPDRQTVERLIQLMPQQSWLPNLASMPSILPPLGSLLNPRPLLGTVKSSPASPRSSTAPAPGTLSR